MDNLRISAARHRSQQAVMQCPYEHFYQKRERESSDKRISNFIVSMLYLYWGCFKNNANQVLSQANAEKKSINFKNDN
jgi:hypothetical protein